MTISPQQLYDILLDSFQHQHWWPVDSVYHQKHHTDPRLEIIIGAILTQNTAWTNVEKALENLKRYNALSLHAIHHMKKETLLTLIQPSGFFNQKAQRLLLFTSYLYERYHDDLTSFFSRDTQEVRQELLSLHGIGPETADSILLYAGNHPLFVVDAYTRRICGRLPLPIKRDDYDAIQSYFMGSFRKTYSKKKQVSLYQELHALLVRLAKTTCKKKPVCDYCPLTSRCEKCL
jgi:endonuclease III related protein